MASLGQIYDLLREMGLVDGQRTEPLTAEEVEQLNALLWERRMDQLLDMLSGEDPPGAKKPLGDLTGELNAPSEEPPWD